jgi:hypothetical protein
LPDFSNVPTLCALKAHQGAWTQGSGLRADSVGVSFMAREVWNIWCTQEAYG